MKNKRWKRAAKRVQGHCFNMKSCIGCKYEETCDRIYDEYEFNSIKKSYLSIEKLDIFGIRDTLKVQPTREYKIKGLK